MSGLGLDKVDRGDGWWSFKIDLRSGTNMPLNVANSHRMPSVYLEFAFSETLEYNDDPDMLEISDVVKENVNPVWNQEMFLDFATAVTNPKRGSLWVSVYDQQHLG